MKVTSKTNKATVAAVNKATVAHKQTKLAKLASKASNAINKIARIASAQWKLLTKAGVQELLGHGGVYCLRANDITGNLLSTGKLTGTKRMVAIISGSFGYCFIDGLADAKKQFAFGGNVLDLSKVKNVVYYGNAQGAVAYVVKHGEKTSAIASHYTKATHVLRGSNYGVATGGKRLVRDEWQTNGNGTKFVAARAEEHC